MDRTISLPAQSRRQFLSTTAMALAAGISTPAMALSPNEAIPSQAGAAEDFPALKLIQAGLLNIGYAESGPADGPAVILLHGWPYDIHSFTAVSQILAAAKYRVIVPYLRGYGTTTFLSATTFRNAQPSASKTTQQDFYKGWASLWAEHLSPAAATERAATDVHAPGQWRTNAPLMSQPGFGEAFGCKAGASMQVAADKQIKLFP